MLELVLLWYLRCMVQPCVHRIQKLLQESSVRVQSSALACVQLSVQPD